jgi:hypothetical protein
LRRLRTVMLIPHPCGISITVHIPLNKDKLRKKQMGVTNHSGTNWKGQHRCSI